MNLRYVVEALKHRIYLEAAWSQGHTLVLQLEGRPDTRKRFEESLSERRSLRPHSSQVEV